MAYAMFRCCVTAHHLREFDDSTDALLARLGVDTAEIPEFGCCGYPLKNVDIMASLAASARNLALAERAGKTILTACACCYGTLAHSVRLLEDKALRDKVNERLAAEGLRYEGSAGVRHLFHALKDDVGIERLIQETSAPHGFQDIALQYGCKLLRPSMSVEFGAPGADPFFEQLVTAIGANVVDWGLEKDCCASGIRTTDQAMARTISEEKMNTAGRCGADGVAAACPFCILQLRRAGGEDGVPVLSISQLLCLALGLDAPMVEVRPNGAKAAFGG